MIDLNCDAGESYGNYIIGNDETLFDFVTSVNVACGFHAGDYNVMRKTVQLVKKKNRQLGAHPGLPDLIGFGRRKMEVDPDEIYNLVLYQLGALSAFARCEGIALHHVKPHGALYHMANMDHYIAEAVVNAIYVFDPSLFLYALAGSGLVVAARKKGLQVAEEVFADRTYLSDGTLTPRSHPEAVIRDPLQSVKQVLTMVAEGIVIAIDGSRVPIRADTICVHGDHPEAIAVTARIYQALLEKGILT